MSRIAITLAIILLGWAARGAEKAFDFREDKVGEAPRGFRSTFAGSGPAGTWKVIEDNVPGLLSTVTPLAPAGNRHLALAQLSREETDEHFPILTYEEETFGDFSLTMRFKLVEGAKEQMAGIAFRMQDERNYYYVRASGLGNSFYFFKVVDGQRSAPIGNKVEVAKGIWHELTLQCKATKIWATLNGKEVLPQLDDKTFGPGKIGFWTKSDAVSYFTDIVINYKPRQTLAQSLVHETLQRYPRLLGLKIYAPEIQDGPMRVVASMDGTDVGQAAPKEAEEVLAKRGYYYGKNSGTIMLTLPLRDHNGDKIAAVRVLMRTFPGQTEKNALARAMPVVHGMETRIQTLKDLTQ